MRQDRIFLGQAVLARWEYAPEQWRRHLEAQFRERREASRGLLMVVGVIMLLVGGGFAVALRDEAALIVAGVLLGVFLLLVLVAILVPRRRHRFLKSRPGLVMIASGGVYLAGEFHDFRVLGSCLDGAAVRRKGSDEAILRIGFSYPSRAGRQSVTLDLPVPSGREAEAERVAAELSRTGEAKPAR